MENNIERFGELKMKLIYSSLKNFAGKFEENTIPETSSYVEFFSNDRRFVFKKSSICWLFRNYSYKSSSDRRYRIMNPIKKNKKDCTTVRTPNTKGMFQEKKYQKGTNNFLFCLDER